VSNLSEDFSRLTFARIGMQACLTLINQMLESCNWEPAAMDRLHHFISAARILADNRNLLIHSNLVHGWRGTTTFYRVSKQGKRIQFDADLSAIRRAADDLNEYFWFGHKLANAIAVHVLKLDEAAGVIGQAPWPDIPPLPAAFP
jgi:hypothetical protein